MAQSIRETKGKELAYEVVLMGWGVLFGDNTQRVKEFLRQLDEGKVTLDKKYAMSSVLGTGA